MKLKIKSAGIEYKYNFQGNLFFWADQHINHGNIIKYCNRPFLSPEEKELLEKGVNFKVSKESVSNMNRYLIEQTNRLVGIDDYYFILGDIGFNWNSVLEYLNSINCENIFWIYGNHDPLDDNYNFYKPKKVKLVMEQCLLRVDNDIPIVLNHYAMDCWENQSRGYWHLHGHVHNKNASYRRNIEKYKFSLDIGVDGKIDGPYSLDDINTILKVPYESQVV